MISAPEIEREPRSGMAALKERRCVPATPAASRRVNLRMRAVRPHTTSYNAIIVVQLSDSGPALGIGQDLFTDPYWVGFFWAHLNNYTTEVGYVYPAAVV